MNNADTQSKQYDFFLSCSHGDNVLAELIVRNLTNNGLTVFMTNNMAPGADFGKSIVQAIRSAKALIVIASDDYFSSKYCQSELQVVIESAEYYDRKINCIR